MDAVEFADRDRPVPTRSGEGLVPVDDVTGHRGLRPSGGAKSASILRRRSCIVAGTARLALPRDDGASRAAVMIAPGATAGADSRCLHARPAAAAWGRPGRRVE